MNLGRTRMYSAWHLNINYSSVEVRDRPRVIERCYWPLLNLAEISGCPQGIEISGSSLQVIQKLDPSWIQKLVELENLGLVEVLASGYQQVIGPLVPAEINYSNFYHGQRVVNEILGVSPALFFVNEQCASSGVLDLIQDFGFQGAILEWENAWIANQNWSQNVGLTPQRFRTNDGLPIIWNHSRFFQGLQRFVHKELDSDSLLRMYQVFQGFNDAALCFYGGDAEAFGFRAGRFSSEAKQTEGEWRSVEKLLGLSVASGAHWTLPSDLLTADLGEGVNPFTFENPILTKKQPKYNVVRWAVSGRNNYELNNYSHKLTQRQRPGIWRPTVKENENLLDVWASDLRTHITEQRWSELANQHPGVIGTSLSRESQPNFSGEDVSKLQSSELSLENKKIKISLDPSRGMTVSGAVCKCKSGMRLLGRLPFGSLQGPLHSPDWFSGNFVHSPPAKPLDSDISYLPESAEFAQDRLSIKSQFSTANFKLSKSISLDPNRAAYTTSFEFEWKCEPAGSLRAGFMTLIPESWAWDSTYFGSNDGGIYETIWRVSDASFDMGAPVSTFVSASGLAGISEGRFWVGDSSHKIEVELDDSSRGAGLMLAVKSTSSKLFRSYFSLQEHDDTFQPNRGRIVALSYETRVKCTSV